jgi:hypothetical protein
MFAVGVFSAVATAQQPVAGDPAVEELRRRIPSGANDDATIDAWLNRLFDGLGADAATADLFRNSITKVYTDGDTTAEFRTRLTTRLAEIAKTKLTASPPLSQDNARAVVWTMRDMDRPETAPSLLAALKHPAPDVRYLAVRGLMVLKDRIAADPALLRTVVDGARAGLMGEPNGVVAEWAYRALKALNTPDAAEVMVTLLESRVDRYRNGSRYADGAEKSACQLLAGADTPQNLQKRIVNALATLLRLDVEVYTAGAFVEDEQDAIERRVVACESLLEQIVKPGKTGGIRAEMQNPGPGVAASIQIELLAWIGSASSDGALNTGPWSVPKGAP